MRKRYVDKLFIRDIKRLQHTINTCYLALSSTTDIDKIISLDKALIKAIMDLTEKLEEYQDYRNG